MYARKILKLQSNFLFGSNIPTADKEKFFRLIADLPLSQEGRPNTDGIEIINSLLTFYRLQSSSASLSASVSPAAAASVPASPSPAASPTTSAAIPPLAPSVTTSRTGVVSQYSSSISKVFQDIKRWMLTHPKTSLTFIVLGGGLGWYVLEIPGIFLGIIAGGGITFLLEKVRLMLSQQPLLPIAVPSGYRSGLYGGKAEQDLSDTDLKRLDSESIEDYADAINQSAAWAAENCGKNADAQFPFRIVIQPRQMSLEELYKKLPDAQSQQSFQSDEEEDGELDLLKKNLSLFKEGDERYEKMNAAIEARKLQLKEEARDNAEEVALLKANLTLYSEHSEEYDRLNQSIKALESMQKRGGAFFVNTSEASSSETSSVKDAIRSHTFSASKV